VSIPSPKHEFTAAVTTAEARDMIIQLAELKYENEAMIKLMTERAMLEAPPPIILPGNAKPVLQNAEPVLQNPTATNQSGWKWWSGEAFPDHSVKKPAPPKKVEVEMLPMGKRKIRLD
jgi:hypothetical protein